MCLNSLPLQARLGLLFSFSAYPQLFSATTLSGSETSFFSPGVGRCSPIRSQLAHTAPTGPVCGLAGVVPLPGSQNRTQGHTGPSLVFASKTRLPLPLKGEGLGIVFLGFVGFPLLVQNWPTRLQQGRSGALLVSFPYPTLKTAHRATQGRVWFHRLFLVHFETGRASQPSKRMYSCTRFSRPVLRSPILCLLHRRF